ncbi:MAG: hypothetical protein H7X70_05215, partial [Candidatus Kapabacteria bacterium]|nr:hypothetical protein [Candidatus Kapabacteria bacterium]
MKNNNTYMLLHRIALFSICLLVAFTIDVEAQTTKKKTTKKSKKTTSAQAPSTKTEEVKPDQLERPDLNTRPGALPSTTFVFPKY